MHPILAHGRRLGVYVSLSLLVGCLLSVLLVSQDALTLFQAALIALPLSTIYAAGKDTYVFVREGDLKPVKVVLGLNNETHAEVKADHGH